MKENFLQIAEYIEALEKRLAALEERLADTENKLADTQAKFAEIGQHVAELEARPVDSEIEMDWIDEPETKQVPETPERPAVVEETPAQPEQPAVVEETPTVVEKETPTAIQQEISELPGLPLTTEPSNNPFNGPKVVNTPVADLKHAISLGDRFLFQRELFNQNGELMQKTLEALNGMPNIDGALAYLDKHFDWDKESPTFALFLNALHRRFG